MNSAIDSIIREQNITVILAAHRLSSIARAERVIVLEDGVVSEEGRYEILVSPRCFTFMNFVCQLLIPPVEQKTREPFQVTDGRSAPGRGGHQHGDVLCPETSPIISIDNISYPYSPDA